MNFPATKANKKESILVEALHLKEIGTPLQEIILLFPDSENGIRELFETENAVLSYLSSIAPSPDALYSILGALPAETEKMLLEREGVTNNSSYRYLYDIMDKIKDRFKFKEVSNFMLKKFLAPGIVILLVAAVGFVALRNQSKIADKVAVDNTEQAKTEGDAALSLDNRKDEISLPPQPAANPDAITDAIIALAVKEQSEFSNYDDGDLLESDSEEIAELNTIYDETDFQ